MEEINLLKVRLVRLGEICKAGLKELDCILEKQNTEVQEKVLQKIRLRDVGLAKYDKVFYSLIIDILLKKDIL